MQFEIQKSPAKLDSFTPRAELHGDEKIPACSIGITIGVHSSALDQFDPSLRPFLFRKAEAADDQPSLLPGDKLTALAKPNLKPLVLDEDFTGYTLRIHPGLDSSTDIVLGEAKLSTFKFKAIAGGSVEVSFSLAAHPSEEQAGRLYGLVQKTVDLTLEAPKAAAQRDLAA